MRRIKSDDCTRTCNGIDVLDILLMGTGFDGRSSSMVQGFDICESGLLQHPRYLRNDVECNIDLLFLRSPIPHSFHHHLILASTFADCALDFVQDLHSRQLKSLVGYEERIAGFLIMTLIEQQFLMSLLGLMLILFMPLFQPRFYIMLVRPPTIANSFRLRRYRREASEPRICGPNFKCAEQRVHVRTSSGLHLPLVRPTFC